VKKEARNPVNHAGAFSGEFVTEMFEYDGGRQVTVYVPPDPPEAIIFASDGQGISTWGRLLEKADVPSTMILGVHGLTDEMLRLHEYSPGFEPERFAAHEKFFVEDVRRWAESRFGVALPAECTAVFGASAGGELALALGLRHPHVFGAVLCRLAAVTGRLALCRVRFRAHTLSLAHRSRSSSRTQGDGRTRCAVQMRMSS
jgi:enterochelin esterase-like enzyme